MRIQTSVLLVLLSMIGNVLGYEDDVWYERHTTEQVDTEPPDMEYQSILFEATETLLGSRYQLDQIMDAYNNTNWTRLPEMKVFPKIFNETGILLKDVNRTLIRKMDLGYYFVDKDLSDPITRVMGGKLIECFQRMKKYVDKFQTEKVIENYMRKGFVEMRLHINTAIQDLEYKLPELLEQMRLLRYRVTEAPY